MFVEAVEASGFEYSVAEGPVAAEAKRPLGRQAAEVVEAVGAAPREADVGSAAVVE